MIGLARRLTLRQRLLALVAVALVPALLALFYFIAAFHREREREVHDQAASTSQIVTLEVDRILTGVRSVLETLAFAPLPEGDCRTFLAAVNARLPQVTGFAVADSDGTVSCAVGSLGGQASLAGTPAFEGAIRSSGLSVGLYQPPTDGQPAALPVAIAFPYGGRVRLLEAALDLGWLGDRLRERNTVSGSAVVIADRAGTLIAREPDPQIFVGTTLSEASQPLLHADRPGTTELVSPDGTRRIVGYQPPAANDYGLYVGVGYSTEEAFAPVFASTKRSLLMVTIGAAAGFVLAWVVGNRLFRSPIQRILDTIARRRAGDEAARTGITGDASELSALAASIDEYLDSLAAASAARHAADDRRMLLLREMNHRIKNILAAVQAIANQTFRDRATPDSLRAFGSRLAAMAAAHDLLVSENWESADLHETIAATLRPFGTDQRSRFSIDGPPVQITARAALSLAMALHELCTNAAKYGALVGTGGHVEIRWKLEPGEAGPRFVLTWTEHGGPPVTAPTRRGFGTRMIEAALASDLAGTAELDYRDEGLVFRLDADATVVLADTSRLAPGTAA